MEALGTKSEFPVARQLRVLLIDDEPGDREIVREALSHSQLDLVLEEANSTEAAKPFLSAHQVDCVLLDIRTPEDTELNWVPELGQVPVIVLTSTRKGVLPEKAIQLGAQDYLPLDDLNGSTMDRAIRYAIERKQTELLRTKLHHAERLAALGGLAASVAHEVNNPSSFVLANLLSLREYLAQFTELVSTLQDRGAVSEPELKSRLESFSAAGNKGLFEMTDDSIEGMRRITSIVRQMQTFSRAEDSQEPVAPVSLNKVAEWSCLLAWPQIRHRARLEKQFDGALPMFSGHQARLGQVVTNLLVNAAQALDDGDPETDLIRISTKFTDGMFELAVEDSGPGIPDAIRDRVLDPFFTTKPVGQGTGLGLSVSLEIVKAHRGELHIETREGSGTRIRVTLPQDTGLIPTLPMVELTPCRNNNRLRVLLVDDEPAVIRAYRRLLHKHDILAGDAHFAVQTVAEDQAFDAIICDLMMPGIDGPAFYEFLEQQFPSLAQKVVFLTGGVFTDRAKAFVTRIDNCVLQKPVTRESLLDALAKVPEKPKPVTSTVPRSKPQPAIRAAGA